MNFYFFQQINFNLGIGIGDDRYEIQKDIYDNNIEEVIKKIIANKNYEENNVNLVIGGSSQKLNALALKYGLGTNQWEGDKINLLKKIDKEFFEKHYLLCKKLKWNGEKEIKKIINLNYQ